MTLRELIEERADVYQEMNELNDRTREAGMDDKQEEQWQKLNKNYSELTRKIKDAEEAQKVQPKKTATEDRSYAGMFNVGGGQPEESFNDFLRKVAVRDPELRQFTTQTDELGGYITPTEWAGWLLDNSLEAEIIRQRARVFPMDRQKMKIPAWDGLDRSGGDTHGGFEAEWLAELGTATRKYGNVRNIELEAHKLAIYTAASREVLADAVDFESQLKDGLVRSLSFHLDKAFLTGTGTNEPQGLLNTTSKVVISRDEAAKVKYADLIQMYSALWKHGTGLGGQKPIWICSHEVIPELMSLKDGNGHYLWQPSMTDGIPAKIFGYDIIPTEKTDKAVGVEGDLILTNLREGYGIGLRQDVIFDTSNAPGWLDDQIDFRTLIRCDGQELWDKKITTESGKEMSWCVVLGDA